MRVTDEVVKHIDAYLAGSCAGDEVAHWAAQQLGEHTFSSAEVLLEEALSALVGVGFGDSRYDTSSDELRQIRSALRGEGDYVSPCGGYLETKSNERDEVGQVEFKGQPLSVKSGLPKLLNRPMDYIALS